MTNALIIGAVLALLLVIVKTAGGGARISGADARAKVESGAMLLDVRTAAEFRAGHIAGAVNIPMQNLATRMKELGATGQTVIVYCQSGGRSRRAASMLRSAGYEDVHNLGPRTAW